MRASQVALGGAVVGAVAWAAKAVAIGVAGGLGESPLEDPLFFLGLVSCLTGAAALGVGLTAGRPTYLRVVGALGVVAAMLLTAAAGGMAAAAVEPADPSWVWGEVNLWVAALCLLTAVLVWRARRSGPS